MIKLEGESYEVLEDIGTVGRLNELEKHLVHIKWFRNKPWYEIRTFGLEGEPLKRSYMTMDELRRLKDLLDKFFQE